MISAWKTNIHDFCMKTGNVHDSCMKKQISMVLAWKTINLKLKKVKWRCEKRKMNKNLYWSKHIVVFMCEWSSYYIWNKSRCLLVSVWLSKVKLNGQHSVSCCCFTGSCQLPDITCPSLYDRVAAGCESNMMVARTVPCSQGAAPDTGPCRCFRTHLRWQKSAEHSLNETILLQPFTHQIHFTSSVRQSFD